MKGLLTADLLESCQAYANGRNEDVSLDDIGFEPVIPNPGKIICVGINYHAHKIETGNPDYEYPMLFARYPESQIGHEQPMLKPRETERLDFEGEMAVIIGKTGRRISQENALSHVAGYACYNDGSVRNYQRHTSQFLPGKTFVGTGGFGPWMVTADEIPDPSKLTLETRLNGKTVQSVTTDLMINSVPALIEYVSTVLPISPGDVIVSGTPGGVGDKRTPPLYMFEGDVVEVEISGVGLLRNTIKND
ncbi:UNVERIFIED_CONTAM: hypothetical protein GTU68_064337 [Idotea baltica]|nr:hypothetical protein [Idotea baltica]